MKRKKLLNKTRGTVLTDELVITDIFTSLIGNMGRKKISPMVFKTNFGIHTFFVRNPMDVLVLDKKNIVIQTKMNLKSWRLFFWNPTYDTVIELPTGTIKNSNTEAGDRIILV